MENIKVDFSINAGKVKPMHARVNNGPVYKLYNRPADNEY